MPIVLQFDRLGNRTELQFRDIPAPQPGPGEVRYRVAAFGLNRGDLFYVADTYYNSPTFPARVGNEAAGIVDAVGAGVTQFKVGDRVSSIPQADGRYCVNGEFAISLERYLAPWPKDYTAEQACSVWAQAITAYYSLVELAKVQPGDTVLITAGSSTTGVGAIQLARLLGARVITTSRTRSKQAFLKQLGADAVIASDECKVGEEIMRITAGKGVRVVFDTIAGSFVGAYADGLAERAQVHLVGALGGDFQVSFPILPLVRTGSSITGFSIFNHHKDAAQLARAKRFILEALEAGKLKPVIDRVFDFPQTIEAYGYMEQGGQKGKIVIRTQRE